MNIPTTIIAWREATLKTPTGWQVIENIENELNVPDSIANQVFNKIRRRKNSPKDPFGSFEQALADVPVSACAGCIADVGTTTITRFVPLARIADQPDAKRRGYSEAMLRKNPARLRRIQKIALGRPPRNIVWAALEDPVRTAFNRGATVNEVVDRLGLMDDLAIPMAQIIYSTTDAPRPIKVPTSFDAGADHRFRPAAKGAPCGLTRPLSLPGDGYPEYVHKSCVVEGPGLRLHLPS